MNPHAAYRNANVANLPRIDMLLALFDRSIDRLEQASAALVAGNRKEALDLLLRAQGLVMGLASGVDPNAPLARTLLPLYNFIAQALSRVDAEQTSASIRLLATVREGFRTIRSEAIQLERNGGIAPIGSNTLLSSLA